MILSKVIRPQEGIFRSQSCSPTTIAACISKITSTITHQISVQLSQGTRTLLHRQSSTLFSINNSINVIRAQQGIPRSQNSSPATKAASIGKRYLNWPKNIQNHPQKFTFRSGRGLADINQKSTTLLSINGPTYLKLLGPKKKFPDHKVAPRLRYRPVLATVIKNDLQHFMLSSVRAPDSCYISNQALYFQ